MEIEQENKLIQEYNDRYPIEEGKETPFILLMDGTIGSGKTTVINDIAKYMNVKVLSNDKIRSYLQMKIPNISFKERECLVKEIQYPRIKKALDNGNIVILDGDISNNFEQKIAKIREMGYPYYIIRIICDNKINSMRVINRDNRLKKDLTETTNYSLADYEEFLFESNKKNVLPDDSIFYEINTSGSLESIDRQVQSLVYNLLSLKEEVVSINEETIHVKEDVFMKKTSKKEYDNLLKIYNKLNGKQLTINKEQYSIKIPSVYDFKDNTIYMEKCAGENLELLLRKSKTHAYGVNVLNQILKYLMDNHIYWFDFAPRNIMINKKNVILVDFERNLIFDEISKREYFRDIVYEEYSAFLSPSERIINKHEIYDNSINEKMPNKLSKRVLTIANLLSLENLNSKEYYDIINGIISNEEMYFDKSGNPVFPLVVLENLLIKKGYEEYAKKIVGGLNMRKEYKPFSNVKGFYINEGFLQSDTGLNLRLRKDGFVPKSGLIYNTVLDDCAGKKVLDLGCGDLGILGVLARQNGAMSVDSVDIDSNCVDWFNKLIDENAFTNMHCYLSDNFSNVHNDFDMILTNLAQMPMLEGSAHDSGGIDGRDNILEILNKSLEYLRQDGYLYMLLFDFLGIDKRTNNNPSLEEIADKEGYKNIEILESVDKEIVKGSVTYDSIDHILDVYPKYNFETNSRGNPYCKIKIARFQK